MNKTLLIIFLVLVRSASASDLTTWSNEDLCRWVDSVSIPEPISLEIKLREVICYEESDVVESSLSVKSLYFNLFNASDAFDKSSLRNTSFLE